MFLIRRIAGFSMTPLLKHKQLVILQKTKQFKVGQIVYFKFNGLDLIKRIINISQNGIYLQGDYHQSYTYFVCHGDLKARLVFKL